MPISQYTYLIGTLFFLPIWLFLYLSRKDLDKKMLEISLVVGVLSILSSSYFWIDYWQPEYIFNFNLFGIKLGGIEDFFYGFFTAGIVSVFYEEIFGKRFTKRKSRKHHWFLLLSMLLVLSVFIFYMLFSSGINSIYAGTLSFFFVAIGVGVFRRDLVIDAIISSLFFGLLTFIFFILYIIVFPGIFQKWWYLHNLSGQLLLGIPLEEIMWAFGMGAVAGPIYEFMMGLKLAKYTVKRKR